MPEAEADAALSPRRAHRRKDKERKGRADAAAAAAALAVPTTSTVPASPRVVEVQVWALLHCVVLCFCFWHAKRSPIELRSTAPSQPS